MGALNSMQIAGEDVEVLDQEKRKASQLPDTKYQKIT